MRILMLAAALATGIGAAAAQTADPLASDPIVTGALPAVHPTLKRQVTVTSDIVRIGDLIDHAGPAAATPIFRAPDPGETGAVPAYRVAEAVRRYGISLDVGDVNEVMVAHAGSLISPQQVEAALGRVIADQLGLAEAKDLVFKFRPPDIA